MLGQSGQWHIPSWVCRTFLSTKKFFVDGSPCENVNLREMYHIHFQAFSILRPLVATAIDAAKSAPTFLQNKTASCGGAVVTVSKFQTERGQGPENPYER